MIKKVQVENKTSKLFLLWFPVLIILIIKSTAVLVSLYSYTPMILIYSFITILPLFFLISFSFLFKAKGQLIYLFGLDLFLSLLFIVDMIYGRAYGHLISIYMMFAKNNMNDLNASIISLIKWTDFLMLIDLPFFLILVIKANIDGERKKRALIFISTCFLCILLIFYQFVQLEKEQLLGNYKLQPLVMSPAGYHFFDLYRFFYEKSEKLNNQDMAEINTWLKQNIKYQEPDKQYTDLKGTIKGKNIIVIQVESLEGTMIGKSYYGQEITPNINKLLGSSIYFDNIHEQVKDGNSSDAELLSNASMYPISNGSAFLRFGENTYVTMPKLLKKEGYTSVAVHGDEKEFWNRDHVFPAFGFNKYISEEEFKYQTTGGMGILDESLFKQSILEIENLKQPYHLFIITLTSHMPFKMDKSNKSLNLPNDDVTSDYLQSIHYTDKAFGEFYNSLSEKGLLDNTVLVIYGDHEGIHKYYKTSLPNNNFKIPFIVHIPGMKGFKVDKAGGQVDIMPTLAFLLGIDKDEYSSKVMGRNLFDKYQGEVVLPNGEILGKSNDAEHLKSAQNIADLIIKGNYFKHN